MQEGDALAFGADAGRLVDQPQSGCSATRKRPVEVVHGEAHVMDAGAPLGHKLPDRRVFGLGFEQFHQRFSGSDTRDSGAVGVVERNFGHPEDITIEREQRIEGLYGNPNVGDARAAAGYIWTIEFSHVMGTWFEREF